MAWTQFWDMHSGGQLKEKPYHYIYIEGTKAEAIEAFRSRFGHNPRFVTCNCCGPDYEIEESESLEEATAYHRGCAYKDDQWVEEPDTVTPSTLRPYRCLDDYLVNSADVLVLPAHKDGDA